MRLTKLGSFVAEPPEIFSAKSLTAAKLFIAGMPVDWIYLNHGKNLCHDDINSDTKKIYNSYTYKCATHVACPVQVKYSTINIFYLTSYAVDANMHRG